MHAANHHSILFVSVFLLPVSLLPANDSAGGAAAQRDTVASDNHLTQNGFLKIDGTPRLMIGLYELPRDDEKLAEIAANGFNLVRVPQDASVLDRVQKHGLYAWICLGVHVYATSRDFESK